MNFVILAASFVVALLGFVQGSRADSDDVALFGLTDLGLGMIAVATLGFCAGLVKEYRDGRDAREAEQREKQTANQLEFILVKLDGLQKATTDPETREQIGVIAEGLTSVASLRRHSDFRLSDFTASNFTGARFTGSYFAEADFSHSNFDGSRFDDASMRQTRFVGTDLSGADLSAATIDEHTKLPGR